MANLCHGAVMPRRKKKFMLLRSVSGNIIVVERRWYDYVGIAKKRGNSKAWWIVAQSDDHAMLHAMAKLTDRYLNMKVNHTREDEKGNITNVRSTS